jgi:catechol-2,3-dioxygenase
MKETGQFIDTILQQKDTQVETVKLFMPEGEGQIELLHFSHPENQALKSLVHFGLTHIAIKVKELDSLYARLKSEFVEFLSAPALSDNKKAKVCFCKDPDGVFLEFVEVQN